MRSPLLEEVSTRKMYIRDWRTALRTPPTYRLGNRTFRFHFHIALIILCFGSLGVLFLYAKTQSSSSSDTWLHRAATQNAYNSTYPLTTPVITNGKSVYRIAMIADLDKTSKVDGDPIFWRSFYTKGHLTYSPSENSVSVTWEDADQISSSYSYKGRGMELSELTVFNGRLLTFDDRTGIVYEIIHDQVVPWLILPDGDGHIGKGFKSEWATVKDKMLYVGSIGKEWTSSHGDYENDNPMYVKVISPSGEISHLNWSNNYKAIREVIGITWPGYMIHESGMWSAKHKRWFFLPRRCSKERYNETRDEHMGCNILITATENFEEVKETPIGNIIPTHGYSSFKFIPETNDSIIVALTTEETNGKTATYISAFTVTGEIVMEKRKISSTYKYEGLEFI